MTVTVAIPSYKRAGNVRTRDLFPDGVVCVHEFEADEYREKTGGEIAVIPDALRGNMSKVRNWILDTFDGEWLVMVDDDLVQFGYFERDPGDENTSLHAMRPEEIRDFIRNGFVMVEDVGAYLWGVNLQYARRFYREYSPFSFLSPVLGTFSCIRKNPLRYDERLYFNEDYDYALQHFRKYHKILRFVKYHYIAGHLTDKGGCGSYRTVDQEKEQAEIMQGRWGRKVVTYDFKKSFNPILNVPLKGV